MAPGQSHQFFSALYCTSITGEEKVEVLVLVLQGTGRAGEVLYAMQWAANSRAMLPASSSPLSKRKMTEFSLKGLC